ncbi:MAG TPA: CPBP family intramembrane glutamic endopeptidase [Ktedonobacterales bacterium]|nr:CPBP family intramembrane glutamic endopeptidase [Ktedonobacterales bacterium]
MTSTPGGTPPAYESYPPVEAAPSGGHGRYGQVGQTPWTFAQTVRGALATLIPWLVFIIGSQLLTAESTASGQRRLSTPEDIVGGIFAFFVTGVVEFAFVIAPAYYAVLRRAPGITLRQGLAALGLRRTPLRPAVVATVGGFAIIITVSVLYSYLLQVFNLPLRTNSDVLLQQAKYAPITTLALIGGAVLIAPICEELFFRGFLFAGLLHRVNLWPAVLLSAFLFALAHGDIGSFVVLFVIGVVLAFVRWRVGSIWPGMIIHAANNATAAVVIILVLTAR